jgi:predicted DNA-binding protein
MNTFSNCGDNEKIIADADTDNKEIEMEMVEMAVELPVEMLERLKAIAEQQHKTLDQIVIEAISLYLEKDEQESA